MVQSNLGDRALTATRCHVDSVHLPRTRIAESRRSHDRGRIRLARNNRNAATQQVKKHFYRRIQFRCRESGRKRETLIHTGLRPLRGQNHGCLVGLLGIRSLGTAPARGPRDGGSRSRWWCRPGVAVALNCRLLAVSPRAVNQILRSPGARTPAQDGLGELRVKCGAHPHPHPHKRRHSVREIGAVDPTELGLRPKPT